ncbi:hypothetical protein LSTR_LSTR000743 [Laodelphax striatellus]|uniref:DRBM domain-containing protein n=1 Tax=Laodelphax striatellus TaxID=195883 RepID=A0A482XHJ3_LAOST|nr:hypothetical protein LSTR_LSTR000743 [Laodelphax striatellus]
MSSKTPVSTLHEMFAVKGITPYYNLTMNGEGSHNPIFKYSLQCGDLVSHGFGKSKMEAKHDAAQNALNQLRNKGQFSNGNEELLEKIVVDEANIPVVSPYQDDLKQNVVGALIALCASNRISEPVYQLIGEEGPPHCKTFTIQCSVLHLKEVAQARTKKQAKHKSSKVMLDKLQEYFNNCLDFGALEDVDGRPEEEEEEEVKNKYISIQKSKPVVENLGLRISDYHTVSSENNYFLLDPKFEKLKSMDIEEIVDPVMYVMKIFEGLDIELVWEDIPSLSKSGCLKAITIHSSPSWCFVGAGGETDEARRSCALQILKFFRVMLR